MHESSLAKQTPWIRLCRATGDAALLEKLTAFRTRQTEAARAMSAELT